MCWEISHLTEFQQPDTVRPKIMLMRMFHALRLEISQNRPARWINCNRFYEMIRPGAWEPEVLQCLREVKWNGPVWDVGAAFGRHAYRLARERQVFAFEPNLNTLQFLAYNLRKCPSAVVVPCALTPDGKTMKGTYHADFMVAPTGPQVATLSVSEALQKFGRPGVIKLDIEGGEYELLKCEALFGLPLLVEWHREIPRNFQHWDAKPIDSTHSLLTPRKS
jgi:FkbM family methyltransferase